MVDVVWHDFQASIKDSGVNRLAKDNTTPCERSVECGPRNIVILSSLNRNVLQTYTRVPFESRGCSATLRIGTSWIAGLPHLGMANQSPRGVDNCHSIHYCRSQRDTILLIEVESSYLPMMGRLTSCNALFYANPLTKLQRVHSDPRVTGRKAKERKRMTWDTRAE
jgi:hypothetical protein